MHCHARGNHENTIDSKNHSIHNNTDSYSPEDALRPKTMRTVVFLKLHLNWLMHELNFAIVHTYIFASLAEALIRAFGPKRRTRPRLPAKSLFWLHHHS